MSPPVLLIPRFFFKYTSTPEIYTFPYTTLFRSRIRGARRTGWVRPGRARPRSRRSARPVRAEDAQRPHSDAASECGDRKSTRLNSSHTVISYAVFCLKKKKKKRQTKR